MCLRAMRHWSYQDHCLWETWDGATAWVTLKQSSVSTAVHQSWPELGVPAGRLTSVHAAAELVIMWLTILTQIPRRGSFWAIREQMELSNFPQIVLLINDVRVRSFFFCLYLVCNYCGARRQQGSWCSRGWMGCSRPTAGTLRGHLRGVARGQEAKLETQRRFQDTLTDSTTATVKRLTHSGSLPSGSGRGWRRLPPSWCGRRIRSGRPPSARGGTAGPASATGDSRWCEEDLFCERPGGVHLKI